MLTESVFAIPGLGKYGVDAIKQRDLPAVLGSVLFLAITFSFVNLLTDPSIASRFRMNRESTSIQGLFCRIRRFLFMLPPLSSSSPAASGAWSPPWMSGCAGQ